MRTALQNFTAAIFTIFNFERKCMHERGNETICTAGRENTLEHGLKHQQNLKLPY